jgi:hypothetical protein
MLGVVVSMISAIGITRVFLLAFGIERSNSFTRFIFGSGISSVKKSNVSTK